MTYTVTNAVGPRSPLPPQIPCNPSVCFVVAPSRKQKNAKPVALAFQSNNQKQTGRKTPEKKKATYEKFNANSK
jgi:hypothetical protein